MLREQVDRVVVAVLASLNVQQSVARYNTQFNFSLIIVNRNKYKRTSINSPLNIRFYADSSHLHKWSFLSVASYIYFVVILSVSVLL